MAAIFSDDIFKCFFINEKVCILIWIPPKCVPKGPIDNNSALVQVMAWRRIGDKPLPETEMIQFTDTYMRRSGRWVKLKIVIDGWDISCHSALRWMLLDLTDDKSTSKTSVDPGISNIYDCHHIASLGHKELTAYPIHR